MLPLILSIEGVYSYQEKQTINFEQLTNAGLFGIFGKVGSGKSTILESIGFVLYGDTERMNSKDKISYNMLNLKSSKASIEFDFLNYENKKYRFVVTWKREKKFEKTSPFVHSAYVWENGNWIPLASTDATKIVGLSYENFKRTIIIPQGKFKEFLDLKGTDRSEMMKEIFHLQRFDLAPKVGSLKKNAETIQSELRGKLEGFEEVTSEIIEVKKEELVQEQDGLKTKKEESGQLTQTFNVLETLKNDLQALNDKKEALATLNDKKEAIRLRENQLNRYTLVERIFKSILQDSKNKKQEFLQKKQQKEAIELEISSLETDLAVLINKLSAFEENKAQLDRKKKKVEEYDGILQLKQSQKTLDEIQQKISEFESVKKTLCEEESSVRDSLTSTQTELETWKKNRIDPTLLIELGSWYNDFNSKIIKVKGQENKIEQLKGEINQYQKVFTDLKVDQTSWRTIFDTQKLKVEAERDELLGQNTKALVRKELAHFSSQLHEGENCPLCGSLEHPSIMKVEDVSVLLSELEKEIKAKNQTLQTIDQQIARLQTCEQQLEQSNKLFIAEKEILTQTNNEIIHLKKSFKWNDFPMDDTQLFEQKKKELKEVDDKIKTTENELQKTQERLNGIAEKLKNIETESKEIDQQQVRLDEERKGVKSRLQVLCWEDFITMELNQISAQKLRLSEENARIEEEINTTTKLYNEKEKRFGEQKAVANVLAEQISILNTNLEQLSTQINQLLNDQGFTNIHEVTEILNQAIDVEVETEEINKFHIAVKSSQKLILELEEKVQGREFSMEEYILLQTKLSVINEEVESLKTQIAKKEGEVQRLEGEYVKKADLLIEFEKINKRVANLNVLTNLFKGNGFVNYVSGIYLRNLADNANARFHRITKNQLSLIINDKNEFEVIDYLNNGATRSVKTLSGGQSFQASLCLALALAESIQTQNSSDKNFFFIDEGFGTQDAESVELVYQTLQSLLKENRIVGFISHLAELQERIPQSITILKNVQTGSYVTQN
jgi:exonuclease SbcC